ncbi:hypothetical protein MSKU15_2372 [Komagataeibacter diospyri]|uniref:Uncharacterized protein n=1 Tax=Komagataeibacter diospyri TaxID=1932662 RepID=A0A4P5NW86_9PROT|nr:hypothetical protein MSKU9_2006 [Komagataeibacter diospyri]GCE90771.1 hypothetical protein MSKU15_2372 [Komagataeibacter diospyri]
MPAAMSCREGEKEFHEKHPVRMGPAMNGRKKTAHCNGPRLIRGTGCQMVLYMFRVHLRSARPAIL